MSEDQHATPPQPAAAPFAVLFLPDLLAGAVEPADLFLPFTFVYLLSLHVRFCLPVSEAALPLVEKIFDQVLDGHTLLSKGIAYIVAGAEHLEQMMQSPLLLVTTEAGAAQRPELERLPQALMCRAASKAQMVRLRNLEKLADEELKGKLVGCAQLINIQSGGFITEGHFSLSW